MQPILITLDFINDIIHHKGKIPSAAQYVLEHQVLEQVNRAIAIVREINLPIAHVKVGFSPSYIECPLQSPVFGKAKELGALKLGEWGTEFHETLAVKDNDIIIIKHRVSALYATKLSTVLTANKIDTVIITGVSTNMAVETLARELHDRDYQVIILEDACAAANKETHEASLVTLKRLATVSKVDQLNDLLRS